jgi:hypothetical protein
MSTNLSAFSKPTAMEAAQRAAASSTGELEIEPIELVGSASLKQNAATAPGSPSLSPHATPAIFSSHSVGRPLPLRREPSNPSSVLQDAQSSLALRNQTSNGSGNGGSSGADALRRQQSGSSSILDKDGPSTPTLRYTPSLSAPGAERDAPTPSLLRHLPSSSSMDPEHEPSGGGVGGASGSAPPSPGLRGHTSLPAAVDPASGAATPIARTSGPLATVYSNGTPPTDRSTTGTPPRPSGSAGGVHSGRSKRSGGPASSTSPSMGAPTLARTPSWESAMSGRSSLPGAQAAAPSFVSEIEAGDGGDGDAASVGGASSGGSGGGGGVSLSASAPISTSTSAVGRFQRNSYSGAGSAGVGPLAAHLQNRAAAAGGAGPASVTGGSAGLSQSPNSHKWLGNLISKVVN